MNFPAEPYRIKVVERLKKTTREQRAKIMNEAGNNIFLIPAESIYIDLLTDSGTSAMSDEQWAGMMTGDESYAGAKNFYHFEGAVKKIFGFKHVIPTHQGRAAENLLFSTILKPGQIVPNNSHFDTTRANIEYKHGIAVDLLCKAGLDPNREDPFKGNMDVNKLENLIKEKGISQIPLVMLTITNNSGGGQPVSMENIRLVSKVCKKYKIPFFFDACRFAENAYFIKTREKGFENKSIEAIAQQMFTYADGCTMSAKKDALVNIGGFLALNNDDWTQKLTTLLILTEGFPTYGGLAGRDLEAIARGLVEVLDFNYLDFRVNQVRALGQQLTDAGIPILRPTGGHAVYLNVKEFLANIPQSQFPGVAITVNLYREYGIRAVEIGSLMFAAKDEKGEETYPELELVRLAIPRRVYTNLHLNYVAESIIELYKNRKKIRGLKLTYQAPVLRHFTARLVEI